MLIDLAKAKKRWTEKKLVDLSSPAIRLRSSARATTAGLANGLDPMHGLRLSVREEAVPLREQPTFAALEEVAARGLLSFETWQCNRAHISLKATIAPALR